MFVRLPNTCRRSSAQIFSKLRIREKTHQFLWKASCHDCNMCYLLFARCAIRTSSAGLLLVRCSRSRDDTAAVNTVRCDRLWVIIIAALRSSHPSPATITQRNRRARRRSGDVTAHVADAAACGAGAASEVSPHHQTRRARVRARAACARGACVEGGWLATPQTPQTRNTRTPYPTEVALQPNRGEMAAFGRHGVRRQATAGDRRRPQATAGDRRRPQASERKRSEKATPLDCTGVKQQSASSR